MKKVSFTEMKYGTKDDYQLLEKLESQYERKTADRILNYLACLLYTSPSPRDTTASRMPSSA